LPAVTHHAGDAPDLMFDAGVERIFTEIDPTTRAPGVHIMTGPIFVEGAEPGDMLEVRYLQMVPRNNYGSNLAANWGHLYQEFDEKERVTIYELDPSSNTARALYAYDFRESIWFPAQSPIARSATATRPARHHHSRPPASGHSRRRPAVDEPVSTIPRPARRQHRQLAHRRGIDDVLQMPGQGRPVFDRRPHVSQGDGEISGTAIESSLNCCSRSFCARISPSPRFAGNAQQLDRPRLWRDLDEAMKNASMDMLHLLTQEQGSAATMPIR
jgi:hypothetical protein